VAEAYDATVAIRGSRYRGASQKHGVASGTTEMGKRLEKTNCGKIQHVK